MTSLFESLRTASRLPGMPRRREYLSIGAMTVAFALASTTALAPPPWPTPAEQYEAFLAENSQSLAVSPAVSSAALSLSRDTFAATPGIRTFVEGGTNHDWAKLVLLLAGFPITENNVTVFTRWMRQENYTDSWWNRNNPLNNGWGSGGGGGLGSYDSLVIAAENAAEALLSNPGYSGIVEAFRADAPTEVTEAAIWASPWASGHYNNGKHWSYVPVPVIDAPDDAWQ